MDIRQWRQAVAKKFAILDRTPAERMTWVTIILDARVVRQTDDIDLLVVHLNDIVAAFAPHLRAVLKRSGGKIGRDKTRWVFTPELDLLHPKLIGGKGSKGGKYRLLTELGVNPDTIGPDERVGIIHVHGLIDHRGYPLRADLSVEDAEQARRAVMLDDLRSHWPEYRRVVGRKLDANKTLAANLRDMSGYCTKMRFEYGNAWEDGRTTYGPRFEPEWRSWVQRVYSGLKDENWLISSLTAQRSECIPPLAQTLVPQGNREDGDQFQLTVVPHPSIKEVIKEVIKDIKARRTTK